MGTVRLDSVLEEFITCHFMVYFRKRLDYYVLYIIFSILFLLKRNFKQTQIGLLKKTGRYKFSEDVLPFWSTFEQNSGLKHKSNTEKPIISLKTSIYANFWNVLQPFEA